MGQMPRLLPSKLIVSRMCSLKGCGYNNPSPSLLHLPGAWVSSLLQRASQGRKTGKDPSASVVSLLIKSPLTCLKGCPALVLVLMWPFYPSLHHRGNRGRAGAQPWTLLLPVLCPRYQEHIPAGSGVCTHPQKPSHGPRNRYPVAQGGN